MVLWKWHKFRSNTDGYVYGLRYYKIEGMQDLRLGNLWTRTGTHLASKYFTTTTQGWQSILLDTPVPITADSLYVVSFFSQKAIMFRLIPISPAMW
jgi:hypothetical protein